MPIRKGTSVKRGDKRERLRDQAIAALLTHNSIRAAADQVGVDESTLQRWLKEPAFGAAYRAASASVLDGAIGRLQAGLVDASEALLLSANRASVQVNAAKSIFDLVNVQAQLSALAAQLQALEQRLQGSTNGMNRGTR
jgi:Helix-turn-helix domain of transposase family ISL3